jgi:hypothetical protein
MLFYVLALVLGIWLTVRKLDVARREAADFPNVDAAGFAAWKARAQRAYNLGSMGCFAKLLLDVALEFGAPRIGVPWRAVQIGGALVFLAWVGVLVTVWVLSARARRLQEQLGIRFLAPSGGSGGAHERQITASEEGATGAERKEGGS